MSYYLAPIANEQQVDENGSPVSGGKLFTYIAGTSTPATTYTDDSGGTAQANPIILNSRGLPASPVWLQSGRSYKFVITDANDVVLQTIDDVTGINDPALVGSADQWVTYANAPSYISATSFSVAGDQTSLFQVNRRLRSANTGGTIYSTITASAFAAGITTVTVVNDSGSLDSGLSQVSYALLSAINPSIPMLPIRSGTAVTASGTSIDFTSIPAWVKRITINLAGVSTNGTDNYIFRLGTSAGVDAAAYSGKDVTFTTSTVNGPTDFVTGFGLGVASAAATVSGRLVLELLNAATNTWTASGQFARGDSTVFHMTAGSKPLVGTLDRVRLTTSGGVNTFDAGTVNINYE